MSQYHLKCTEDKLKKNKKEPPEPPPDLFEKTYSHTKVSKYHAKCADFKKPPPSPEPEPIPKRSSLLDVLNPERDCICELVARAVRSHMHMNLGLEEKRDGINGIKHDPPPKEPEKPKKPTK